MAYKYAFQKYDEKTMAKGVGISLPISYKQAREICSYIKNKKVDMVKKSLNRVLEMKEAIPYKRFNMNAGHKPGNMAAGRYPQNSTFEILKLVEGVEKNAANKGLSKELYIAGAISHRAPASPRGGRTAGEAKRAHVEIIIEEREAVKEIKRESKKEIKKEAEKENKKEERKETKKEIKETEGKKND